MELISFLKATHSPRYLALKYPQTRQHSTQYPSESTSSAGPMHIFIEICKSFMLVVFSIFAQKPAETPLREQELLMRGEDLPITQMRRKHITVHPKVQFSLQLNGVKEIGSALEYGCAFPSPVQN